MSLVRLLLAKDDDGYDLICLKKDEALGLIIFMLSLISFIIISITKVQKKFGIPLKLSLER